MFRVGLKYRNKQISLKQMDDNYETLHATTLRHDASDADAYYSTKHI